MAVAKLHKEESATLQYADKSIELPVEIGSEGEIGLDISKLRAQTGLVTIDSGFVNTASCRSAITYLDGENGILRYRGYAIEDLAARGNFLEVAYLLIHGELPSSHELETFNKTISAESNTEEFSKDLIKLFPKDAHPMGALSSGVVALSGLFPDCTAQDLTPELETKVIAQLMAQVKNLSAMFCRHAKGQSLVDSEPNRDYCSDFLTMMFGEAPRKEVVEALNILLILHADHEQNCSTSAVRLIGSSKANLYATISGGIQALWGPLHGGANQAVIEMLEAIQKDGGDYKKYLAKAKDKSDPFKLMGFGHRVYKNFDPRAKIIKTACDSVLKSLGVQDPLLDVAKGLEEEALKDEYFVARKLYPNVDFYSGIIYKALDIPTNMFTVMFVLGRLPGWIAQWKEMVGASDTRIGRPRQIYTGSPKRDLSK